MFIEIEKVLVDFPKVQINGSCTILRQEDPDKQLVIRTRPFVFDFLENMAKLFDIFIFTRLPQNVARPILEHLDPTSQLIQGLFCSEYCYTNDQGILVKDLRIFKNLPLLQTVLIDDEPWSFCYQLSNGIPLIQWDPSEPYIDSELLHIQAYLEALSAQKDVAKFNRYNLKLHKIGEASLESLMIS